MIDVLRQTAAQHPNLTAVVSESGSLTYRALLERLQPVGGRQVLALPNGPDWLTAFWSAMAGGAVLAPLNPRAKPAEVDAIKANFFAADSRVPDGVRVVQYTAGTTGRPRGALLTAEGLLTVAAGHARSWKLTPGDAIFVPNPASHIMGLVLGCLMPTVAQATVITMERFEPGVALELIERYRPVAMAGTPTHYHMLAEHPDLGRRTISSLRFGLAGGAASTPEAITRVMDRLGLEALLNGYGMSEASGSISRTELGDPIEAHAFTVGRPMPWLETRLVDRQLEIRGKPVTTGYLGDPTAATDPDGWFATGDMLELDADGRLRFKGRLKDMLTVGGFNVYPAEVERVLGQHPAVAQAQVVGVSDPRLGEIPVAFIRLTAEGKADAEELRAFCEERLSGYKVPRRFEFITDFPTNSAGKVEKYRLRELAARAAS
ncbi:MAG TPA: AMP-binding protein [Candidatus Dormibacteraeota bacterium]